MFAALTGARADALLVLTDTLFLGQRQRIVKLAAQRRLPALYSQREYVDRAGWLRTGRASLSLPQSQRLRADDVIE